MTDWISRLYFTLGSSPKLLTQTLITRDCNGTGTARLNVIPAYDVTFHCNKSGSKSTWSYGEDLIFICRYRAGYRAHHWRLMHRLAMMVDSVVLFKRLIMYTE